GAIGHLAEQCSAESRLCFNCKQPGHESATCPNPRTADAKQCYSCSGIGHLAMDCPSVKVAGPGFQAGGQKCYTCGRFGHISRMCSQAGFNNGSRGGYPGASFKPRLAPGQVIQCYKCQGMNHYARDCMAPGPAFGGVSSALNRSKTCYRCQLAGHIARDCPTAESTMGEVIVT
ncbi:hypothetical protein CROQUDRAFT_36121, partial [Cronartium quercuum f. sp. fusiforme G11]